MTEPIYLLDFRRRVVERIDGSVPPRGVQASAPGEPEKGPGFVLAALGSPPEDGEE